MDLALYWQRLTALVIRVRSARTERGASMVEYAFLLALIALVCIVAVGFLGGNTATKFSIVANSLS